MDLIWFLYWSIAMYFFGAMSTYTEVENKSPETPVQLSKLQIALIVMFASLLWPVLAVVWTVSKVRRQAL